MHIVHRPYVDTDCDLTAREETRGGDLPFRFERGRAGDRATYDCIEKYDTRTRPVRILLDAFDCPLRLLNLENPGARRSLIVSASLFDYTGKIKD